MDRQIDRGTDRWTVFISDVRGGNTAPDWDRRQEELQEDRRTRLTNGQAYRQRERQREGQF